MLHSDGKAACSLPKQVFQVNFRSEAAPTISNGIKPRRSPGLIFSAPSLNDVMASAHSYGFSFVGFGREPRGKFSMDEFRISRAGAR